MSRPKTLPREIVDLLNAQERALSYAIKKWDDDQDFMADDDALRDDDEALRGDDDDVADEAEGDQEEGRGTPGKAGERNNLETRRKTREEDQGTLGKAAQDRGFSHRFFHKQVRTP